MKPPKDWSVYLVRCSDKSLYTGVAKDVAARLAVHNAGKGAAYTRSRLPVDLVYHRKGLTRSAALIEEARIKGLERAEKLAFLKKAVRSLGRAAGAAALLWALAVPATAVPTFNQEYTIMIASATPQAFTGENAVAAGLYTQLRMYYLPAISSAAPHSSSGTAILSATSTDGEAWVDEGVRLTTTTVALVSASSITGCALQPLSGGGFRMLYSIVSTTGAFRIHSSTSFNGLAWSNEVTTAVDGLGTTYVGVPRLVVLNSGDWRLYYTRDFNGGDDLADRHIFTARSTDEGATWGASSVVVSTTAYESGAAKLTNGRIRLFYSQPPSGASSATVILSSLSSDALGTSFSAETGVRLSTSPSTGALSFPVPVRATDTFRWRLYYTAYESFNSTGDVRSALTSAPAPVSLTPSTVFQSAGAIGLAVDGEIFSPTPAASITRGAVTIVGTGVVRSDDLSISATFATQNQQLGLWDLTVTNADGFATTLANALLIDFAPGTVVLTGNLLRPREGVPTSIDTTIFAPGPVTVRVYDLEGRLIRVLLDQFRPAGAFTTTWDGKSASGAPVPSGLYFVAVNGPKVAVKSKIVLIR